MTTRSRPRPASKHCPACGIAMLGSKSDPALSAFDTWKCLECEMVIAAPAGPAIAPRQRSE